MMRFRALWAAAALLASAPAGAQVVAGTLTDGSTGNAVRYAAVSVTTPEGVVVASTSSDGGGRFTLRLDTGGPYVLRVTEPGYRPIRRAFTVPDGGTFTYRAHMTEVVYNVDRDHSSRAVDRSRSNRGAPPPPATGRPREN